MSERQRGWIMLVRADGGDGEAVDTDLARKVIEKAKDAGGHCRIFVVGPNGNQCLRTLKESTKLGNKGRYQVIKGEFAFGKPIEGRDAVRFLHQRGVHRLAKVAGSKTLVLPEGPLSWILPLVEAASLFANLDIEIDGNSYEKGVPLSTKRDLLGSGQPGPVEGFVGESKAAERIRKLIQLYAKQRTPVLILGETGVGKEVVARELHRLSEREGTIVAVNAAGLDGDLAQSTLFGHLKGTFTGAHEDRSGRIVQAENGTFFLDEILNLSPSIQAKLLRALNQVDDGLISVEPVGFSEGTQRDPVKARFVAAAHRDPRLDPREGQSRMREDLFYRVGGLIIEIPPLREREDDIQPIAEHQLKQLMPPVDDTEERKRHMKLDVGAVAALKRHDWPGNVRELRMVLKRAMVHAGEEAEALEANHVEEALEALSARRPTNLSIGLPCQLELELQREKVRVMTRALERSGGNKSKAGRSIGMETERNFGRDFEKAKQELEELEDPE